MRILIATAYRGLWGGVEKYLQSLIPGLVERGHSVALLYESHFDEATQGPGIDHEAGGIPAWCSEDMGLDSVRRSLAGWKPDVVYSHGLDDSGLEAALLEEYPTVLYAHTYYGTCVSARKCYSSPRLQPCDRQFGVACLALFYPRRCGGWNPRTMWRLFQLQSERKSKLPAYQAILVASRHMHREYERNGASADRLRLLPLPTGGNIPASMPPRPSAPGSSILFVGRLMDVKGLGYLLEAIPLASKKLGRPLRLSIAGDGPDRGKLEGSARRLGLSAEFIGWVSSERRSDLMRQADLVAVPSLWPEPFGLVGIEAGCFGLPAVGFAVGGIPDWLIPGQTGELAPGDPPTVQGLAEAIARALADPEHYRKLCRGAWEMASQFSLERHVGRLEQILRVGKSEGQLIPTIVS